MTDPTGFPPQAYTGQTRSMPRHQYPAPPPPPPPPPGPPVAREPEPVEEEPSVARSSKVMALGTLASRATGFLRNAALVYVLGVGLVGDAYNAANVLPNMVYELLLGGVLSSVFVPLIVKAQKEDGDRGEAYTQRLLSLTVVALGAATLLAVLLAPLLITLQGFSGHGDQRGIAVALARLLLLEIFFYGIGAILGAVLNTRGHFAAPMWAPILNNFVVMATCALFVVMPGPKTLTPHSMTTNQVLVLGGGTTLGIVVQALALVPALRKVGFRWRWRFDYRNARLREAANLASWMLVYVIVSQVGVVVVQRLAVQITHHHAVAGFTVYTNAQLMFMLPHGIVAVSLITALMPRMSRAAVAHRYDEVAHNLALGTRLISLVLIPVTAMLVSMAVPLCVVLLGHGRAGGHGGADIGHTLVAGAPGLVLFAVSQLQIFAFYAMRDTRTPALINFAVVGAKVAVDVALYQTLPPTAVVAGLMWGNTVSYAVCVVVSAYLLRRRLGRLDGRQIVQTGLRVAVASFFGGCLAYALWLTVTLFLGEGFSGSLAALVIGGGTGGLVLGTLLFWMRLPEMEQVIGTVRGRLGR
jgi:putative peptidoglycan lipid II flippase